MTTKPYDHLPPAFFSTTRASATPCPSHYPIPRYHTPDLYNILSLHPHSTLSTPLMLQLLVYRCSPTPATGKAPLTLPQSHTMETLAQEVDHRQWTTLTYSLPFLMRSRRAMIRTRLSQDTQTVSSNGLSILPMPVIIPCRPTQVTILGSRIQAWIWNGSSTCR